MYSYVAWEQVSRFPEGIYHLLSHFGMRHQCSLNFKCLSLFTACTSKYFSCFMWPENQVSIVPQRRVQFPIICLYEIQFPVSSQWFAALQVCFQLVTEIYCLILLYLLGSGLWPSFQNPKMPRATKNSASVMDTSVNQESSMISQDSSSSDQEMGSTKPTVFPTIYKPATIFCAMNVYILYQRAHVGLEWEW